MPAAAAEVICISDSDDEGKSSGRIPKKANTYTGEPSAQQEVKTGAGVRIKKRIRGEDGAAAGAVPEVAAGDVWSRRHRIQTRASRVPPLAFHVFSDDMQSSDGDFICSTMFAR